jgi:septal ring factor EnvC (AmiA/AmiB activator)
MRVGTSITFLVLVLIAFGFMISDDMQTHQKLSEINARINEMSSRLAQSEESLSACTDQVAKDQQAIDERDLRIAELNETESTLQGQVNQLKTQAAVTEARQSISEVLGSNPIVIACLLVFQIVTLVLQNGKKAIVRLGVHRPQPAGKYVHLTDAEYRLISQRRQAGR